VNEKSRCGDATANFQFILFISLQSLIQVTTNETIKKTASAASQAAVNAFNGTSVGSNLPARNALVSPQKQGGLGSVAGNEDVALLLINLDQAVTTDSVHELPVKLVKEILSFKIVTEKLLATNKRRASYLNSR